jgi:hypothetical protein
MGWLIMPYKPRSIPEYFKKEMEYDHLNDERNRKLTCLGLAFVGRFTLYGVWETTSIGGKTEQFATVFLIRYYRDGSWGYKDMDETMGPCEAKCPKSLLRKLKTPAENDFARAWRKRCWQEALGLTWSSAVRLAKRAWKTDRSKAYAILERWNEKNPLERIKFTVY